MKTTFILLTFSLIIFSCREKEVMVCHAGGEILIPESELNNHLAHGDIEGSCTCEQTDSECSPGELAIKKATKWLDLHVEENWGELISYVDESVFIHFGNIFSSGKCGISDYQNYLSTSFQLDSTFSYSDLVFEDPVIWEKHILTRFTLKSTTTSISSNESTVEDRTYTQVYRNLGASYKLISTMFIVRDGVGDDIMGTEQDSTDLVNLITTEYATREETSKSGDCTDYETFFADNGIDEIKVANTLTSTVSLCNRSQFLAFICGQDFEYIFSDLKINHWYAKGDIMIVNYDLDLTASYINWVVMFVREKDVWKYYAIILDQTPK